MLFPYHTLYMTGTWMTEIRLSLVLGQNWTQIKHPQKFSSFCEERTGEERTGEERRGMEHSGEF